MLLSMNCDESCPRELMPILASILGDHAGRLAVVAYYALGAVLFQGAYDYTSNHIRISCWEVSRCSIACIESSLVLGSSWLY